MSGLLFLGGLFVAFGWGYDESKLTVILVFWGLAFIAWCVEQIRDTIKDSNRKCGD